MFFKKKNIVTKKLLPGGNAELMSGKRAVEELSRMVCDQISGSPAEASTLSLSGRRTSCIVESNSADRIAPAEFALISSRRSPFVLNLFSGSHGRHASSLTSGHDAYHELSDSGAFHLFASNIQEAVDFSIIAHRVSEHVLVPGVVALDQGETAESVDSVRMPEKSFLKNYLGNSSDAIDSPTPAQQLILGKSRRRVPEFVNLNRAVGIGLNQDADDFAKALAGQNAFYYSNLNKVIDESLNKFAETTGRNYARAISYKMEDAEYAVVAQGSITEELKRVTDYLRKKKGLRVGVLNISVLRPFPADIVSKILKGKKGVTIIEKSNRAHLSELPLAREIRNVFDRAIENGSGETVSSGVESYSRAQDCPTLYSAVAVSGKSNPSGRDLAAVFLNMTKEKKRRYYIGAKFEREKQTLPGLELLNQTLEREYPALSDQAVLGMDDIETGRAAVQIKTISDEAGFRSASLLANAVRMAFGGAVKCRPVYGSKQLIDPSVFSIEHDSAGASGSWSADRPYALIVAEGTLLHEPTIAEELSENGIFIVQSARPAKELFSLLPNALQQTLYTRKISFCTCNSAGSAASTGSLTAFARDLALIALVGAFTENNSLFQNEKKKELQKKVEEIINNTSLNTELSPAQSIKAFRDGIEGSEILHPDSFPAAIGEKYQEPDSPWNLKGIKDTDGTIFDPVRFWTESGYLKETGRRGEGFPNPYLSAGMVPARSSAVRNLSLYREKVPSLIAERCTGCGECWTGCPESALPSMVQEPLAFIKAAIENCKKAGQDMMQLDRVADPFAKQAYKLILKDDLNRYTTMGSLLDDAFKRLVDMMALKDDKKTAIQSEYANFRKQLAELPVVKTETFLNSAESSEKGSGLLLSITPDPAACKECGICAEVCPESAIEFVTQTTSVINTMKENFHFLMGVPNLASEKLERFISEARPESNQYVLLNKDSYHAAVGGDNIYPGSGAKIALHLLSSVPESVMNPKIDAYARKIEGVKKRLEDKIQKMVSGVTEINDFESFGSRLAALEGKADRSEFLNTLFGDRTSGVDEDTLKNLTEALSSLKKIEPFFENGSRQRLARMVAVFASGDSSLFGLDYPYNSFAFPWVRHSFADAAAAAEGLHGGISSQMAEIFKIARTAELYLNNAYEPVKHDRFFKTFGRDDFTEEEDALCPTVFLIGDDAMVEGPALSGVLRLLSKTKGIQVAAVVNDPLAGPDMALLAMGQGDYRIQQASIADSGRLLSALISSVKEGVSSFVRIYAPEPRLSGMAPSQTIRHSRLAVDSRVFPVFSGKAANGKEGDKNRSYLSLDLSGNPASDSDGAMMPGDWALREGRFRGHFTQISKNRASDGTAVPLRKYLKKSPSERGGLTAYLNAVDGKGDSVLVGVSDEMIRFSEERVDLWNRLQILSRAGEEKTGGASSAASDGEKQILEEEIVKLKAKIKETEENLAALKGDADRVYHEKLMSSLLELGVVEGNSVSFREALKTLSKIGN